MLLAAAAFSLAAGAGAINTPASALCRTEFQGSPVDPVPVVFGTSVNELSLSWVVTVADSSVKGVTQTAWKLDVVDASGTSVFDGSRTLGAQQSVHLEGQDLAKLKAGSQYSYNVSVWLSTDPSLPSATCSGKFETAPSNDVFPGKSEWVSGGGQFRSKQGVNIPSSIARARAYVTGLGSFYFFVNGVQAGNNVMDPPQTVYSKTVLYSTFDITSLLTVGTTNHFGALVGTYKWGYTDQWINMTAAGGPDGARAVLAHVLITLVSGETISLVTNPDTWEARPGPVLWDHFFHGETYDASLDADWDGSGSPSGAQAWKTASVFNPVATAPTKMQVIGANGSAVAVGALLPNLAPPLRVTKEFPAINVWKTVAADVGEAFVFDFGQNLAGMVRLSLPHIKGMSSGAQLRIEYGEIVQGKSLDIEDMCQLCPKCSACGSDSPGASGAGGGGNCNTRGPQSVCDTYCNNPGLKGQPNDHDLRHEPCFPHQSYTPGFPAGGIGPHETDNRYIGDFNNANMTNIYIVRGTPGGEQYTPFFAGAGFRYVQISGFPDGFQPDLSIVTALRIHSDVASAAELQLPDVSGTSQSTPDILMKIHNMTRAAQLSNLWSIPTDCPQRERRGWMGDAQASCDEAMQNFDMMSFYIEFLNKIRDDQLRYDENHPTDTGALADVVPFDGIGGNPGCPIWQVAYIVIANRMLKHYGDDALPTLTKHYQGLKELMNWFERHANPSDGLLVTACYGDWMGFHPESGNGGSSALTPQDEGTAFYHVLAARYMSQIASAIGNKADENAFAQKYNEGRVAFHKRYFSADVQGYSPCINGNGTGPRNSGASCHGTSNHGSQTSNSMALALGAPPDAVTAQAVAHSLATDVMGFGNKTTTGVVGIGWLFPMLDQYGFSDIALEVLLGDGYPSIGHMAHQNMTTLCENYGCTFHQAGGGSQNHIMLGAFDSWITNSIGGLDATLNSTADAGWRTIVGRVAPAAYTRLKRSSYTKLTRFGYVKYSWEFDGTKLTTVADVPIGSRLVQHTPVELLVNGRKLRLVHLEEDGRVVGLSVTSKLTTHLTEVGSGRYRFVATFV